MKRKLHALVYTLGIGVIAIILYLIISIKINLFLFGYKPVSYINEIDSLLQYFNSKDIEINNVYKSGDGGKIFFITYEKSLNITIIEANSYYGIPFRNINYQGVSKIKVTENKTYTPIVHDPFPFVEQLLHPKKSSSLTILIKKPFQIEKKYGTRISTT